MFMCPEAHQWWGNCLTIPQQTAHVWLLQIHTDFLATWQRILTAFDGNVAAGIVYSQNTGLVLPPWRGGTGAWLSHQPSCRLSKSQSCNALRWCPHPLHQAIGAHVQTSTSSRAASCKWAARCTT